MEGVSGTAHFLDSIFPDGAHHSCHICVHICRRHSNSLICCSRECEAGQILGPFDQPPLPNFRISGLGLVPKHDGGWRIIYRLSTPFAQRINDFIDLQSYS